MIGYEELARSFQARHLAVQMDEALAFSPRTHVEEARAQLLANNYDQAPVIEGGRVKGFVLTSRLAEQEPGAHIGQFQTLIGPGNIVSADAPVGHLLEWIIGPGLLFVIDGREITGFVTVSDFNKQPARAYLYMLLATVEIGLADLLRRRFSTDQTQLLAFLSDDARQDVEEHYRADRALNLEGDFVSYLEFSQLLRIVGKHPSVRDGLGYRSRNAWDAEVGSIVDLRNEVMHPVRTLVSGKGGLVRVQGLEVRLRRIVSRTGLAISGDTGSNG